MIHNHNNDLTVTMFHTSTDTCWCLNITEEQLKAWQEYSDYNKVEYGNVPTLQEYFGLTATNKAATTYEFNANDAAPFNQKASNTVGVELCYVCGRKLGKNPLFFEVINGGDLRLQDGTEYDISSDSGYMGCFPVGSSCAHKFAPNILFKMGA